MLRALQILAPHFSEIREMWNQLMRNLKLDLKVGDVDALGSIMLDAHYATLHAGKMAAYRLALTKCGQSLDRCGVPAVHAMIALSLYLESCCALLLRLNMHDSELTMA